MITCYVQPDKPKSRRVLEAFAAGCGARMASTEAFALEDGDVAFYGVRPAWARLWKQALFEKRNVYYLDNAFFDDAREEKFRVGCNVVQMYKFPAGQYPLFHRPIMPWRLGGEHVVLCAQSDEYMLTVETFTEQWSAWVSRRLRMHTTRPLVVRKKSERRPLADDLRGAWACVVHTSAAANEALIAGVPTFVTGNCAASSMSRTDLSMIECPYFPEHRAAWAAAVAAHQWTVEELARGDCWERIGAYA